MTPAVSSWRVTATSRPCCSPGPQPKSAQSSSTATCFISNSLRTKQRYGQDKKSNNFYRAELFNSWSDSILFFFIFDFGYFSRLKDNILWGLSHRTLAVPQDTESLTRRRRQALQTLEPIRIPFGARAKVIKGLDSGTRYEFILQSYSSDFGESEDL